MRVALVVKLRRGTLRVITVEGDRKGKQNKVGSQGPHLPHTLLASVHARSPYAQHTQRTQHMQYGPTLQNTFVQDPKRSNSAAPEELVPRTAQ